MPITWLFRFQHVAGAGEHQRRVFIRHDHHGFQAAQVAVSPPVLGEFDGGARQLAGVLFELGFKPLEQRERVCSCARKSSDHVAAAQACGPCGRSI